MEHVDHRAGAAANVRVRRADGPPSRARARGPPRLDGGRAGRASCVLPGPGAVRGARRRDRALGRRHAGCRRGGRLARAHGSDPRDRPREPARRRRARRREPRRDACRRGARLLLRARSLEPAGVHDRGQRRRELGRRALPEVRLHDAPRHGADLRAARRRGRRARRRSSRPGRPRPARGDRRLRGHARDCHEDHAQDRPLAARRCEPSSRDSGRWTPPVPPSPASSLRA